MSRVETTCTLREAEAETDAVPDNRGHTRRLRSKSIHTYIDRLVSKASRCGRGEKQKKKGGGGLRGSFSCLLPCVIFSP